MKERQIKGFIFSEKTFLKQFSPRIKKGGFYPCPLKKTLKFKSQNKSPLFLGGKKSKKTPLGKKKKKLSSFFPKNFSNSKKEKGKMGKEKN